MKIFIRTDASIRIGTGHVMRCLALAETLRDCGADVHFICRALSGNLNALIESRGFPLHALPAPDPEKTFYRSEHAPAHAPWLELDWWQDLSETLAAAKSITSMADWLIVDHYAIDHQWESGMREVAQNIMVIDDLADRNHDCDILLDQSYFESPERRYAGLVPENCRMLLGPTFALLRSEFRQARQFARLRGNAVSRILVYFGGNDLADLTGMALSALCCPELEHLHADSVVGSSHPHLESLRKIVSNHPSTRLFIQPDGFVELMLRADLAIGAGGTTTWERLCLNLPAIVITMADNQVAMTKQLHKAGYVWWIGDSKKIALDQIKTAIVEEVSGFNKKGGMPEPGLVDGMGTMRTVETMIPSQENDLKLRPAKLNDMEMYFRWANDPETRRQSFNQDAITWPEHEDWFKRKLSSSNAFMWVMETQQELPVGQIRFEVQEDMANINYSLDLLARGRGWGKRIVSEGIKLIKKQNPKYPIRADAKENNIPSRKIFSSLNFEVSNSNGIFSFYLN